LRTADFDYPLAPHHIAQTPTSQRDQSRLLVFHRSPPALHHTLFQQLPDFLHPNDLLVLNNSRVFPARIRGHKSSPQGARIEALLLEPDPQGGWWTLLRPGKRIRPGSTLVFPGHPVTLQGVVHSKSDEGAYRIELTPPDAVLAYAEQHGEIPLPPYIDRSQPDPQDRDRYQTVYAQSPGSVAAPTAGLHFTPELLTRIRNLGCRIAEVTLHVGLGTFLPIKSDSPLDHRMHEESYVVPPETAQAIQETRARHGRVLAVGTTTLRVLESVARQHQGQVLPQSGRTRLFLHPPADFHVVNGLITNFHLPQSTLLMLVSAFASPGSTSGRLRMLDAYAQALKAGYRFFSYGDAMFIQ
jgi:S-adenosylmethionine:tRNA ribosyltransferase-isomerase